MNFKEAQKFWDDFFTAHPSVNQFKEDQRFGAEYSSKFSWGTTPPQGAKQPPVPPAGKTVLVMVKDSAGAWCFLKPGECRSLVRRSDAV